MDASAEKAADALPDNWTWERFIVVDAGNGEIALHSKIHNKFIRMNSDGNMDASAEKDVDALPDNWTWERFKLVDAGNGDIALHCAIHNKFIRMNADGNMDVSAEKAADALPPADQWTWERFTPVIVDLFPPTPAPTAPPTPAPTPAPGTLPIGAEVALHSSIHNKFIRMHSDGNMDASAEKAADALPDNWTWERFIV